MLSTMRAGNESKLTFDSYALQLAVSASGMTRTEAAKVLHITRQTLYALMAGTNEPSGPVAERIRRTFPGVTFWWPQEGNV